MIVLLRIKPFSTWCALKATRKQLLSGVRFIYSKTGIWNPRLSQEVRLEIDHHWQNRIQEYDQKQIELSKTPGQDDKAKFYALSMFPYPSGNLHLGHVRVYTINDVMARYQRSKGKMVIQPMGWDAFGLPAENAAIERQIQPKEWTYSNIKRMKAQLQELGLSLDWSREFATCDPSYYKWTQYIFLKMFEKGLAFQKKGLVNFDPVDLTVLADEQIDENGCSWRSGAKVEKIYLKQWYLRDTVFSQSLLDGLSEVDPKMWKDIILIQRNWISACNGHRIEFTVTHSDGNTESLTIYTEAIELLYGVSHLWVAPSHYLSVDSGLTQPGDVLPLQVRHPFTGNVLSLVVTSQENLFKHRDIMLAIPSVSEYDRETADRLGFPYHEVLGTDRRMLINSEELNGLSRDEAKQKISDKSKNLRVGGERISEKLNDWLISRQRYWGTPIPIIHCPNCKVVPVPYDQLPVELPEVKTLKGKGVNSPLAEVDDWINVTCPECGSDAKRESDTLDTFVDSSWYFLRYLDPHNDQQPFSPELVNKNMPVDLYVGGKEHALLHLYFARFFCHFLHSIGLLEQREPFKNLLTQGMVKGESFRAKSGGRYIAREQVTWQDTTAIHTETGEELIVEWEKMSKSKCNGVDPQSVLAEFGIDSTRLCILSNVSPTSDRDWNRVVFTGVHNWQRKIWSLVSKLHLCRAGSTERIQRLETTSEGNLLEWEQRINDTRNHTINYVSIQFEGQFHINAAISRLHSYVAWLSKVPTDVYQSSKAYERAMGDLLVILSVMAPHFASELWTGLGAVVQYNTHRWEKSVLDQTWPVLDEDFLMPLLYTINSVQISEVGIPLKNFNSLDESSAFAAVLQDELFQKFSGLEVTKKMLSLSEGHKATLSLEIPDADLGLDGVTGAKKHKKMFKLSKQKNKLHVV